VTRRISLEHRRSSGILMAVATRKKQPAITRRLLLEAAHDCFSTLGHSGSGIGTVIARAGVTSGALFHHFADKRQLTLAWINEVLAPHLHEAWIAPLQNVISLTQLRAMMRDGCADLGLCSPVSSLASVGAEISSSDPALRDAFAAVIGNWQDAFETMLERGRTEGWIHRAIRPEQEAPLIIATICGLAVSARIGPDRSRSMTAATALDSYLDTLRPE
jgi:TetR/AcrR family transcriptional repressor of nem operon